jgi:hypothetical protein
MASIPKPDLKALILALAEKVNPVSHQIRYGVSPEEKHTILTNKAVPGMPDPFLPSGEVDPAASRYVANALGTAKWGEAPSELLNSFRLIADKNVGAYEKGLEGQMAGKTLDTDLLVRKLIEMKEMPQFGTK